MIVSQFRGPELVDIYEDKDDDADVSFTDIVAARVRIISPTIDNNNPFAFRNPCNLISFVARAQSAQFRKPSEFRRISIALARIAEVEEEDEEEEFVFRRSTVVRRRLPKLTEVGEEEKEEVSKVSHMKEIRVSLHQYKNDFLSFLDKLTANVEWLVEIE